MNFFEPKNNSQSLTEKVMAYKATGNGLDAIQDTICLFIYEYCPKWTRWDEDTRSDFLLFFHPRIETMIERYVPHFRFETYLMSAIRWGIIRFREKEKFKEYEISWVIKEIEKQNTTDMENYKNNEPGSLELKLPFQMDGKGRIADFTTRRRLICAIMLSAAELETEVIPGIAHSIGVKGDWLYGKMTQVQKMIQGKTQKREKLAQRLNECWFKMDSAREMALSAGTENRKNMWNRRFKTWSKRYMLASDSIKALKVKPSHAEIGEILDLPAGTVSSSLHHLRKILRQSQSCKEGQGQKSMSQRGDLNP